MSAAPATAVAAALVDVYAETGVKPATVDRPIVRLAELVGGYDLTCTELVGLSSASAVNELLRRGGIVDPPERVSSEALAGFIYVTPRRGAIFIEQKDLLARRRFSVAHELGHYLLHFRPLLQSHESTVLEAMEGIPLGNADSEPDALPSGQMMFTRPTNEVATLGLSFERMEHEANRFAGELLMPAAVVHALIDRYTPTMRGDDLVWRVATEMLVSRSAMRWRLRALGLLPSTTHQMNEDTSET